MTDFSGIHWQRIEHLDRMAGMVDGLLEQSQVFHAALSQARGRPQVLDTAILDRAQQQYGERAYWLNVYAEQFRRWRALPLTPPQREEIERLSREVEATRPVVVQVLALVEALRAERTLEALIGVPTRGDF